MMSDTISLILRGVDDEVDLEEAYYKLEYLLSDLGLEEVDA